MSRRRTQSRIQRANGAAEAGYDGNSTMRVAPLMPFATTTMCMTPWSCTQLSDGWAFHYFRPARCLLLQLARVA